MNTYTVYQPMLNADQNRKVNVLGWDGTIFGDTYLTVTMNPTAESVDKAADLGLFYHAYTVDAEDLDQVFDATNGYPTNGTAIIRFGHPKSGSVGDVIIRPVTGEGSICAAFGWEPMTAEQTKTFLARMAATLEEV